MRVRRADKATCPSPAALNPAAALRLRCSPRCAPCQPLRDAEPWRPKLSQSARLVGTELERFVVNLDRGMAADPRYVELNRLALDNICKKFDKRNRRGARRPPHAGDCCCHWRRHCHTVAPSLAVF
eukprot:COSAG06_NODE_8255_length_2223_cov_1.606403_3_plen_126_part_00